MKARLLRQLQRCFGAEVDGETERRVATAPVEQVEVWAERVLSAATLAERSWQTEQGPPGRAARLSCAAGMS